MKKRTSKKLILKFLFVFLVLFALSHTSFYLFVSSNIQDNKINPGITGQASFRDEFVNLSPATKTTFFIEWFLIVVIALIILIKGSLKLKQEMKADNKLDKETITTKITKSKTETDLDVLYRILKERKVLRLEDVAKYFHVSKETALEWFNILEDGDLAEINYPTFGDPKIVLPGIHDEKKGEEKKNKEKGEKEQ